MSRPARAPPNALYVANTRIGIAEMPAKIPTQAAHERDESTEQNGLRSMVVEEVLSFFETLWCEANPPAVARHRRRPASRANPIAEVAAGDRPDHTGDQHADNRERPAPSQRGCRQ